jgi:tetratricopeptide (TPR) repeat protein
LTNFWFRSAQRLEALLWLERALEHSAGLDLERKARLLTAAARMTPATDDGGRGRALADSGLTCARAGGTTRTVAMAALTSATFARDRGDHGEAAALLEESIALFRDLGLAQGLSLALHERAELALRAGDLDSALQDADAAMAVARENSTISAAALILRAANVRRVLGETGAAENLYREGLELCVRGASYQWIADALAGLAVTSAELGDLSEAGRLWAAAEALEEESGRSHSFDGDELIERISVLRERNPGVFDAGAREGCALALDAAGAGTLGESLARVLLARADMSAPDAPLRER